MIWKLPRGPLDLSRHGLIIGVLNVTPDSFSDGGSFLDAEAAIRHALALREQGADIIDIGGESTRPGAAPVSEAEELRRVVPVIEAVRRVSDVLVSIDTSKATVAEAAVFAGADIINDVAALRGEGMPGVAAKSRAGVVLMHMQGEPRTMQKEPRYGDVAAEVEDFLRQRLAAMEAAGIDPNRMAVDPGIGFGKTYEHNLALLRALPKLAGLGRPILVGVSRKSFLSQLAHAASVEDRLWPGVALTSFCRERGARILRVHEPRPHLDALRMTEAILG